MKRSTQLREEAAQLQGRAESIRNEASTANRALTGDEITNIEDLLNQVDAKLQEAQSAELDERLDSGRAVLNAAGQRRVVPSGATAPTRAGGNAAPYGAGARASHNSTQDQGGWGFGHAGEYFQAVRNASIGRGIDDRLVHNAATTYGSEGVGPDGGFAVPPDYRSSIQQLVGGEGSMLGMTDAQQTSSNQLIVPVDEAAPWHSSGVRAYWMDEAGAATQTKPDLKPLTVRANKLGALVYLTDELLEDAPAMGAYVNSKAPLAMNWKINDAIINGDGVAKPLGLLNAPCKVTVTKEGSQSAATLLAMNILKMWARLLPDSQQRAVWLYNVDILPQLASLNFQFKDNTGAGIAAGAAAFMPPGGLSGNTYATLMGRPMIPTEACQTLGTEGDIILWDPMGYLSVTKRQGVRQDMSIHVEFEKDLTAFRFIFRVGGQPWLSGPVARANGSNTLSTVVTLQTR